MQSTGYSQFPAVASTHFQVSPSQLWIILQTEGCHVENSTTAAAHARISGKSSTIPKVL